MAQFVLVEISDKCDDVVGNVYMQECAVDYVRRALDAYHGTERVTIYQVRASEIKEDLQTPTNSQQKYAMPARC